MLRITRLDRQPEGPCLMVEGRLAGDGVHLLELELTRARALEPTLALDLSGVEFADSQALALLHEVTRRGVKLLACSPLLVSMLGSEPS